ncbi:MAG TPA: nicotinamide riboside transporter PnuC [Erysipelotrichaceae bacterium]|nr:nicotinamide riboside transporter PnuC [Erysipelotrichaceae bacterium]HQA85108.1 nicotinamide riboside transporter PnuC [Erysipelotrichaceae bacterium]
MFNGWNLFEKAFLIGGSIITLLLAILSKSNFLSTVYGLLCVGSAIYIAKGKVIGNFFGIVSSLIYSYLSYQHQLYSEVIVSLFLILPITIYGFISWLKNQNADTQTITIKKLEKSELILAIFSQVIMYFAYYHLLKYFNTEMLYISALSICISVLAFYFLSRMTPITYYAFVLKDIIALSLWIYPLLKGETTTFAVFFSNIIFLINDIYGIFSWKALAKKQSQNK